MNELVFLKNNQALTTSLKVAEYFKKRHDHVIRDIEEQYGDLPNLGRCSTRRLTLTTTADNSPCTP